MKGSQEEAINFYLTKKIEGEIDLTTIRVELKKKWHFTDDEVKLISREISDLELEGIQGLDESAAHFFDHITLSYIMAFIAFSVIICCIVLLFWLYEKDPEMKMSRIYHVAPYLFIGSGVILFGKHYRRIKKYRHKNK